MKDGQVPRIKTVEELKTMDRESVVIYALETLGEIDAACRYYERHAEEADMERMEFLKGVLTIADELETTAERHRVNSTREGRQQPPCERQHAEAMRGASEKLKELVLDDIRGR